MTRSLFGSALCLVLTAGASCAGSKPLAPAGDAGTGGSSPASGCSTDCGAAACIAGRCVVRQPDIGGWAIEIDPPPNSGYQLTEIPAVGSGTAVLRASPELALQVPFVAGVGAIAAVPASAAVIVQVPSQIPGRPDLSFQANLRPGTAAASVPVPDAIRGQSVTVNLIPLSPSDQTSPPYTFQAAIPATGSSLAPLQIPSNASTIRGTLHDAVGGPNGNFTARAFGLGVLVSSSSTTSSMSNANTLAGSFALILAPGVGMSSQPTDRITVQLAPDPGTAAPWVTFSPFALTEPNSDLGVITLPVYAATNAFQVTVHGNDPARTPAAGASVRATTALPDGETDTMKTFTSKFYRDATTDAGGAANLSLIPGDSSVPRTYTLSVSSPSGSIWASQCMSVAASWNGTNAPPALLQDVALVRRPIISGTVLSGGGMPVANVVVTATGGPAAEDSCLAGPASTSVTTDGAGTFTLPLDPGVYQLEYDPPSGSAVPRMTELNVAVAADAARPVQLSAPALVEGEVQNAAGDGIANATVRIFEPRCDVVSPCTTPPLLRAQTQSDARGHFRAVIPIPPSNLN